MLLFKLLNLGDYILYKPKVPNSSLEGGGERSETVGVRSNTPPDLRSDSPQGENCYGSVKYIITLNLKLEIQHLKLKSLLLF